MIISILHKGIYLYNLKNSKGTLEQMKKVYIFLIMVILIDGFLFSLLLTDTNNTKAGEKTAPNTPTGLIVNESSQGYVLSWIDNSNNESQFLIEKSINDAFNFKNIGFTEASDNHYLDIKKSEARYFYRLKAINDIGESKYSNINTISKEEKIDLIRGIGDFESSTKTVWERNGANGWEGGTSVSQPNDQVADGWKRYGENLEPLTNMEFNLVDGGIEGTKSQSMRVKDTNGGYTREALFLNLNADNQDLATSDQLRFKLDQVKFLDNVGLPQNTTVRYTLLITGADKAWTKNTFTVNREISNNGSNNYELICDIKPETGWVTIELNIETNGNLGQMKPGLEIDGAHIYMKKSGEDAEQTVLIPAPRKRNINTQALYFSDKSSDLYTTATNYDALMGGANEIGIYKKLKYFNPNIKYYTYFAPWLSDNRPANPIPKETTSYGEIDFAWALDNHPEWFYTYPENTSIIEPPGDQRDIDPGTGASTPWKKFLNDGVTPLNFVTDPDYRWNYYVHLDDPNYQRIWTDKILEFLKTAPFDGVFIDGPGGISIDGMYTDPNTGIKTPRQSILKMMQYEAQDFDQYVIPRFKAAGIEVMNNNSESHYNNWPGNVIINPLWDPEKQTDNPPNWQGQDFFAHKDQYEKNNFEDTPDIFFQEHGFISLNWLRADMKNRYNSDHWEKSITDMEFLDQINSTVSESNTKYIFQLVHGPDRADIGDPAHGNEGWGNFALASYLLGSNKYSFLGVDIMVPYGQDSATFYRYFDPGYKSTLRLGDAAGAREKIATYSDGTLQKRPFEHGFVLVNGNTTESREFTIDHKAIDQDGKSWNLGETFTLQPNKAEIFLDPNAQSVDEAYLNNINPDYAWKTYIETKPETPIVKPDSQKQVAENNVKINGTPTSKTATEDPSISEANPTNIINEPKIITTPPEEKSLINRNIVKKDPLVNRIFNNLSTIPPAEMAGIGVVFISIIFGAIKYWRFLKI